MEDRQPGRPSSYKPEYCEAVIEAGRRGKSVAWMASQLDVNKDTIYEWAKVHADFSDALARARAHAQAWWEDKGQAGMETPGFGASVWSRSMAARFPDDWREKNETALTGPNGGPVQVEAIAIEMVSPKREA